ncbi:MAG: hypothetical protein ABIQ02_06235, partial [Saprospiraceae bacterium]
MPFRFSNVDALTKIDIKELEQIFHDFDNNKALLSHFSKKALKDFRGLTLFYLYISYGQRDFGLLLKFLLKHLFNAHIHFEQRVKIFLHLALGRLYKVRL